MAAMEYAPAAALGVARCVLVCHTIGDFLSLLFWCVCVMWLRRRGGSVDVVLAATIRCIGETHMYVM
jgi:hypothetical protein